MNRRGAMELSIGTVVVIVLAMTMLILGLVLVRTIFTGAKYNIEVINQKVKGEINKLFTEDKKTVVYLANQKADIRQGESYGVAFAVQNIESGTAEAGQFQYSVIVSDPNIKKKCGVTERTVENWITTGQSDSILIGPGDKYYGIVRFEIPIGSPLCTFRMHIDVKKDGNVYATDFFDIAILPK